MDQWVCPALLVRTWLRRRASYLHGLNQYTPTPMIDQLINELKGKVGGDLIGKIGLNESQADGAVKAAGASVQEVVGGKGADLGTVLNLFSKDSNTAGANDLMGKLGSTLMGKLTGQVGLDAGKAGSVKDLIMPLLTNMLAEKIGGNKDMLGSLMGGKANDLLGSVGGKLGGLGKMFGK